MNQTGINYFIIAKTLCKSALYKISHCNQMIERGRQLTGIIPGM